MANAKINLGYVARAGEKMIPRFKITIEPMALLLGHLDKHWQARPAALRRIMAKHFLEKLVGITAFVVNVTDEVAARVSVPRAKLISGFVDGWKDGDTNLD